MKRMIFGVVLAVVVLIGGAEPASAGISCSSYSYDLFSRWLVCHGTCVYCVDMFGNQLSEYCTETCWERAL